MASVLPITSFIPTSNVEVKFSKTPKDNPLKKVFNELSECFGKHRGNKLSKPLKAQNSSAIEISTSKTGTLALKAVQTKTNVESSIKQGLASLLAYSKNQPFVHGTIPDIKDLNSLIKSYVQNESGKSIISEKVGFIFPKEGYLALPLEIGTGGTKKLLAGIDLKTGDPVAISFLEYNINDSQSHKPLPLSIFEKLRELSSRSDDQGGILPLKAMIHEPSADDNPVKLQIIMMKLCYRGSLFDILSSEVPLSTKQKHTYANDMFKTMLALHKAGLLHGDLMPENVLLHGDHAYISDFDLTAEKKSSEDKIGCFAYLDPEVILTGDMGKYNQKSEVWSLGLILYHLFSGQRPYITTKLREQGIGYEYSLEAQFNILLPWNLIDDDEETPVTKLLSKMVCVNQDERCSLDEAFEMFKQIRPDQLTFNPPAVD